VLKICIIFHNITDISVFLYKTLKKTYRPQTFERYVEIPLIKYVSDDLNAV